MQKSETDVFFFYSQRKSGGKWQFQKLIFPDFFVFFIFLWQAQKPQIWCRYRLISDSFMFKSSLQSIERKKTEKNHFELNIHWLFASFGHKQRNTKLLYQNWNFDENILIFSFVRSFSKKVFDEPELRQIMRSHLILLCRGWHNLRTDFIWNITTIYCKVETPLKIFWTKQRKNPICLAFQMT